MTETERVRRLQACPNGHVWLGFGVRGQRACPWCVPSVAVDSRQLSLEDDEEGPDAA